MTTPTHRHYCDEGTCQYLGTYKWADVEYDMYYHAGSNPALYVCWGDQPTQSEGMPVTDKIPDYAQGGVREALWQARRQARIQGLVV